MSKELLDAIIAKDALNTAKEFNTSISKHIQAVLDNKRQEIGKNIFSESADIKYKIGDKVKFESGHFNKEHKTGKIIRVSTLGLKLGNLPKYDVISDLDGTVFRNVHQDLIK